MQRRPFELPEVGPIEQQQGRTQPKLVELMQRLLADDGCPWDREQTSQSLKRFVMEEASEVMDAIDAGDPRWLQEELGDLSLQVAFLSELARRAGEFGHDDVVHGICEKLVRRHPHVFSNAEVEGSSAVESQWEMIKRAEKGERPMLDGIPRNLPALQRAQQTSTKVAKVGFDWANAGEARKKVDEEWLELEEALRAQDSTDTPSAEVQEEFGDLLFALASWGRHLGMDCEQQMRRACDKFRDRFEYVERSVKEQRGDWPRDKAGKPTRGIPLAELEGYWNEAKARRTR